MTLLTVFFIEVVMLAILIGAALRLVAKTVKDRGEAEYYRSFMVSVGVSIVITVVEAFILNRYGLI